MLGRNESGPSDGDSFRDNSDPTDRISYGYRLKVSEAATRLYESYASLPSKYKNDFNGRISVTNHESELLVNRKFSVTVDNSAYLAKMESTYIKHENLYCLIAYIVAWDTQGLLRHDRSSYTATYGAFGSPGDRDNFNGTGDMLSDENWQSAALEADVSTITVDRLNGLFQEMLILEAVINSKFEKND